ncbi:sodium:solute symporter family protein [Rickettsiales endosymbiont of Stachyamoeba lipophora]|uniref:sodium:solute symporter family protein n=1 Tax=Rickettsiales endosymbiont of Stachyamoeba lipophora TaxID=2486578 RepID=UPI000F653856|nr:sodium:solute symporter family protein [Rickettsiales endosymbiont of Stachyamoeba lipophora]AZL15257.1 sodium:solute symporter family protein [Rickettsiales endosymbiont of Stachyamoeba lipophora]
MESIKFFNVDGLIIIVFLLINLLVGLYAGRSVATLKEYAIGNRDFTTGTLTAAIVATWISGSYFAIAVSEVYKNGLWYVTSSLGLILYLLIIGLVFAPRMKEFLGKLSVAEVMGDLYGKNIRLITAITAIAQAVGMTALQIKVFSTIFSHFLGVGSVYAVIVSSFVVIAYAAFGGIRAITFTDVLQFIIFIIFIPLFTLFVWQFLGDKELIISTWQTNPNFDLGKIFNFHQLKFWEYLTLFIYCAIPSSSSTIFQRILMAKNLTQISQAFTRAAIIVLFIHIFICFIGFIVLSHNLNLDPNNIAIYVLDLYSTIGLKGWLAIAGIMAMIMSTADSWINTGSVIFVNDFCKSLNIKIKNELLFIRVFAAFIGTFAVILALSATNLLELLLLQANFYKPIVTIPLLLAILGFRTSTRCVLIGMAAGFLTVIIWKAFIQPIITIDSLVPGMLVNLIFLVISHYLLGESGGWTHTKKKLLLKKLQLNKSSTNSAYTKVKYEF